MVVCVEGNIGCGKSTALEAFARKRPGVPVFPEPVHEWGDLLREFYANPSRWSLAFSLRVLLSFNAPKKSTEPIVVVERSPLSCRHVFSQLLFNESKMNQQEWDTFKEYYDMFAWVPDVIVYIETPVDECFTRMKTRGRRAEESVDFQYLKKLDFQYETMLKYANVPIVRVDGTRDPETIADLIASAADNHRQDYKAALTRT